MARRVLVTGGTGFVGANLIRRLLRENHEVHLLVRREHAPWRLEGIEDQVHTHVADLVDEREVTSALDATRPDWIFHLATYGAYSWESDGARMIETNLTGTLRLLEAALKRGFDAFVNAGSSSEYGFKNHAPSEDDAVTPNSYYAVTKLASTNLCRFLGQRHAQPVRTLRLYSVYGPYEQPNRLIPTLLMHALRGQLPALVNPAVARDYVYVDDVCDALLRAAITPGQEPGAVYNIGTGVQTPMRDLVDLTRRLFRLDVEPAWGSMADRSWDTTHWVADPRRARAQLGWEASHLLQDGLALTARWLGDHASLRRHYEVASRPT